MKMTSRQLHSCLEHIGNRRRKDYIAKARLHGIELSHNEREEIKDKSFSEKEQEGLNRIIKNAVKRRMSKNIGV